MSATFHTNLRGWTDLDPNSRFRNMNPCVIYRTGDVTSGEWDQLAGDVFNGDTTRKMVYVDSAGGRWPVELELYKHPTGAGALTIASGTLEANTTCRGRILGKDGAYMTNAEDVDDVAGGMLSNYCDTTSQVGSTVAQEPLWATALQEGDYCWLQRRGRYFAKSDGAADPSAAGKNIVIDDGGGTAGAVRDAVTAISTIAEIQENITGSSGKCIGRSNEATAGTTAGYCEIELQLPVNYGAPTG